MDRRSALKSLLYFIPFGAGAIGLAGMGLKFITPVKNSKKLRIYATNLDELPINSSKTFKDLYGKDFLIIRTGEKEVKALSTVCTHLGCTVYWQSDKQRFFCPCHQGMFDVNGNVIAGPPPRKLDSYKIEIDGNNVFVYLKENVG